MDDSLKRVIGTAISIISWYVLYFIMNWQVGGDISGFAKVSLLFLIPLGTLLLLLGNDEFVWEIVRFSGLGLMVIPALIIHIMMLSKTGTFLSVYCVILPIVCISATTCYLAYGYETLETVGFAVVLVCSAVLSLLNWFLMILVNISASGLLIFYLIISIIALAILVFFRIQNGSAFEY